MAAPNILIELDRLHLRRPTSGTSPADEATWHLEHAAVLDLLGRPADAALARARAKRLGVT